MGTRSLIGVETGEGIVASYCHYDGYPSHQLPILQGKYGNKVKALGLIKPGSMSGLEVEHTWDYDEKRAAQPLYHHERGEKDTGPQTYENLADILMKAQECWAEFVYVLSSSGWNYYEIQWTDS